MDKKYTINGCSVTPDMLEVFTDKTLKAFLSTIDRSFLVCIDIEGLTDYLELTVMYQNISEAEIGRVSFYCDGKTPISIKINGKPFSVVFPNRTAIIDNYLRHPELSCERRFHLAKLAAQHLWTQKLCDAEKSELLCNLNISPLDLEYLSIETSAFLLLPKFLISRYLNEYFNTDRLILINEPFIHGEKLSKLKEIAESLGVSFSLLMIQMKKLDLIEYIYDPELEKIPVQTKF